MLVLWDFGVLRVLAAVLRLFGHLRVWGLGLLMILGF